MIGQLFGYVYAWLPASLVPDAFGFAPGLWAIAIYLLLIVTTLLSAEAAHWYLRRAARVTPPPSAASPPA